MYAQYLTLEKSCTLQYSIKSRRQTVCFTHHPYTHTGILPLEGHTLSMAIQFMSLVAVGQFSTFAVPVIVFYSFWRWTPFWFHYFEYSLHKAVHTFWYMKTLWEYFFQELLKRVNYLFIVGGSFPKIMLNLRKQTHTHIISAFHKSLYLHMLNRTTLCNNSSSNKKKSFVLFMHFVLNIGLSADTPAIHSPQKQQWVGARQTFNLRCVPSEDSDLSVHPQSSLSVWRRFGFLATHKAHGYDSDQAGQTSRLIGVRLVHRSFARFVELQLKLHTSVHHDSGRQFKLHISVHHDSGRWLNLTLKMWTITVYVFAVFHKV